MYGMVKTCENRESGDMNTTRRDKKNNIGIGFAFFEKSLCDDSLENTRNFLVDIVQYHLVKAFNLHNNYSG